MKTEEKIEKLKQLVIDNVICSKEQGLFYQQSKLADKINWTLGLGRRRGCN